MTALVFGVSMADEFEYLLPVGFVLLLAGSLWLGNKLRKNVDPRILGVSFIVMQILLLVLIFFSEYYGISELELLAVLLEPVSWIILLMSYFKSEKKQERG